MSTSPTQRAALFRDLLALTAIFGALYAYALGSAPLANPDEGRYAEIPREMVATGDWVTPRLDGVAYFEKPPLVYWMVASCIRAFGTSEWSLRSTPALFGLFGVLLTYLAARRLYGRREGMISAFILGTSILYFALAHLLILDLVVSVLMSATLFCFVLGVREQPGWRRRSLFYGLYATAALAMLTKGLIGVLVTGAVMFLWTLVFNQWKRLRPLHLPTGALLFLAIAAPWHVLVAMRNPGWARFYFVHEHWERFTTTEHGRYGPPWYFVPVVILGLFPWTGFVWGGLRERLVGGWARRRENAEAWFLVVWAVFIFLFFSKSQSKLIPYILPIFPPLAIFAGASIAGAPRRGTSGWLAGLLGFVGLAALLAAAAIAIAFKPSILHDADKGLILRPHAIAVSVALLAGALTVSWAALSRKPKAALAAAIASSVWFYLALAGATPDIQRPGTKDKALELKLLAGPDDEVVHYHEFFHDFAYYADRTVEVVAFTGELEPFNDPSPAARARFIDEAEFRRRWEGPRRIFVVARRTDVVDLFADPTFHYHLLGARQDHYLFSNQPQP